LLPAKEQQTACDRDQKDSGDDRKRKIASHVISPELGAEKLIGPDFVFHSFVEDGDRGPA
jgi:hypothetical protein